jgi:hypothetical protein
MGGNDTMKARAESNRHGLSCFKTCTWAFQKSEVFPAFCHSFASLKQNQMNRKLSLRIWLEILSWVATALIISGLLFPIYKVNRLFLFWIPNIVFILIFFTFVRYLFWLKHTFLGYMQWTKAIVAVLCIPLFMYLLDAWNEFKHFVDIGDLLASFQHLAPDEQTSMVNYVRTEMTFFGFGSLFLTAIMPFRMLISFWRTHNRGTV